MNEITHHFIWLLKTTLIKVTSHSPSITSRCVHLNTCMHTLSRVQLFAIPRTAACQAPLSMEFPRQEHWSGLPFPIPGDLPDPRMEALSVASPALAGRFFNAVPPGKF